MLIIEESDYSAGEDIYSVIKKTQENIDLEENSFYIYVVQKGIVEFYYENEDT